MTEWLPFCPSCSLHMNCVTTHTETQVLLHSPAEPNMHYFASHTDCSSTTSTLQLLYMSWSVSDNINCTCIYLLYKPEHSLFWLTLSEYKLGSSSRTKISSIPMRHSPPMESNCHQSCLHRNVSSLPVAQVFHKCHPAITWSQLCQIKHIFIHTFLCVCVCMDACMHVCAWL